jgi:hypothetical protein
MYSSRITVVFLRCFRMGFVEFCIFFSADSNFAPKSGYEVTTGGITCTRSRYLPAQKLTNFKLNVNLHLLPIFEHRSLLLSWSPTERILSNILHKLRLLNRFFQRGRHHPLWSHSKHKLNTTWLSA